MSEIDNRLVEKWYQDGYDQLYHTGFIGWVYSLVYRFMERPHRRRAECSILEVGSGSGNYRENAKPRFYRYVELDIRNRDSLDPVPGVERVVGDAQELSGFNNGEFDRKE